MRETQLVINSVQEETVFDHLQSGEIPSMEINTAEYGRIPFILADITDTEVICTVDIAELSEDSRQKLDQYIEGAIQTGLSLVLIFRPDQTVCLGYRSVEP